MIPKLSWLWIMPHFESAVSPNYLYFLIVNYNSSKLVARLINSFQLGSQVGYRTVIVNNSPDDQNIYKLTSDRTKIIEATENLGFGKACNLGLTWIYQQNSQAIVWLINPDAYFESDIDKAISLSDRTSQTEFGVSGRSNLAIAFFHRHPQISILGTTVYNSQGQITSAGGIFTPKTAALATIYSLPKDLKQDYIKTDWVSGCSLLINLANFDRCPQFDPRYFLYYEDLDFCLRYGQQGHQIAVTHLLKVIHDTSSITDRHILSKYQHITHSYLIHLEKYAGLPTFGLTNIRMLLNTLRLLFIKPQQGLGKLFGIYNYWRIRLLH